MERIAEIERYLEGSQSIVEDCGRGILLKLTDPQANTRNLQNELSQRLGDLANLGEIKAIALPLPPLAEQTRIVAEVERRLSVVDELEAMVSANLRRATRLRPSVLQKAFAGELA